MIAWQTDSCIDLTTLTHYTSFLCATLRCWWAWRAWIALQCHVSCVFSKQYQKNINCNCSCIITVMRYFQLPLVILYINVHYRILRSKSYETALRFLLPPFQRSLMQKCWHIVLLMTTLFPDQEFTLRCPGVNTLTLFI